MEINKKFGGYKVLTKIISLSSSLAFSLLYPIIYQWMDVPILLEKYWLSSRNFVRGDKLYCYANFSIVFRPNLRSHRGEGNCLRGLCGRKPAYSFDVNGGGGLTHGVRHGSVEKKVLFSKLMQSYP